VISLIATANRSALTVSHSIRVMTPAEMIGPVAEQLSLLVEVEVPRGTLCNVE
jgi:hypothetical protein